MRRQALWLAVAAALSLPIAACHSDNTTGIPAISAKVEGRGPPDSPRHQRLHARLEPQSPLGPLWCRHRL